MTLDNMTGITEGSYTGFCKSQLITCNFVKACNGVCPFEDALKHADKEMNEQIVIDHDRDWIIGCIKHDGFIKTDRFDKANQIILDALSADTSSDLISRADAIEAVKDTILKRFNLADWYEEMLNCGVEIEDRIKALPSADAVQGEWKCMADCGVTECDQCGWSIEEYVGDYNYCPNCGARMKGGAE